MKIDRQHIAILMGRLADRIDPPKPPVYGVRIVHDLDYQGGEDDAEIRAELESGKLLALGLIVIKECPCCGDVDESPDHPDGALWGVLTYGDDAPVQVENGRPGRRDVFALAMIADSDLRALAGELIDQAAR